MPELCRANVHFSNLLEIQNSYISGCEQQQSCSVVDGRGDSASSCRTLETTGSVVGNGGGGGTGTGTGSVQAQSTGQAQPPTHVIPASTTVIQQSQQPQQPSSLSVCYASCCAESAKKVNNIPESSE